MFHNISASYRGRGTITPEAFATDVHQLLAAGFRPVSAGQLAAFLEGRHDVPANAVLITFDDGYAGVYSYMYPVLKRYHVPATVFLIAGYIGKKPGFLTWPQAREMAASGLVTFGGHTFDAHYPAPTGPECTAPATVAHIYDPGTGRKETPEEYRTRMLADSLRAQEVFHCELGSTTPYFAYPYGAYTPKLDRVLLDAGYRYFFTVLTGANKRGQNPHRIYRVNAGVPEMSPEKMVATIRGVARGVRFKPPPSTWLPRWARDPASYAGAVPEQSPHTTDHLQHQR
ncbi:polysaccharide deacetylase family protein [Desulfofundulus thermosubterraneus]|uniref:Polysaccharide deacetylase n=1 Tax=Desulfofundulus thermosubterraneus DSM 16057 TaxID=1121432 RepID=A0A1M6GYZ1_9FIRM|nr:polysaccharide deacetylase family protein [Desulfofundulus thermosubterraneus]SHJ15142.1 Polysaccharide deacetylase [Desulfofundulus thermosubterraneus DSM 16057]